MRSFPPQRPALGGGEELVEGAGDGGGRQFDGLFGGCVGVVEDELGEQRAEVHGHGLAQL